MSFVDLSDVDLGRLEAEERAARRGRLGALAVVVEPVEPEVGGTS